MKSKNLLKKMMWGFLPWIAVSGALNSEEVNTRSFYPNPGIVAFRGGKWVGSDHLYNLTNKIDVVVEIIKPETSKIGLTEEAVKARIENILKKGGIEPLAEAVPGKPPLPVLHVLVMVQPVEKGVSLFCEGRLFESVTLERIQLDSQTIMQAITWENQNFIVAPLADIVVQANKSIDEVINNFVTRYQFYEKIKNQVKKN